MPTKRHSVEQIVRKLREAEVELARGATVKDACRKLAIAEHTCGPPAWPLRPDGVLQKNLPRREWSAVTSEAVPLRPILPRSMSSSTGSRS